MHPDWPGIEVPEKLFAEYCADRPEGTHTSDLYLACACAHRAEGALQAFDRVYLSRVDGFLARQRLAAATVDDIKQQLRERLFVAGRIRDYSGQGPLANWLRVVSVRAAVDLARKRTETPASDDLERAETQLGPAQPELDFLKETYREAVARAFQQSLGDLPSEQRSVLHLHFVEGLTLDELASLFHVHRATVARRIAEAREAVLDQARRRFSEEAQVAPGEVDSVFALVRSRIDLTLSSSLGNRRPG